MTHVRKIAILSIAVTAGTALAKTSSKLKLMEESNRNFPLINFFHGDKDICYSLYEAFHNYTNVSVTQEEFTSLKGFDCLIAPCFTSYGLSQGFIETVYR
jgi:hypothetical protein